jgi:diguanylate cyclase (GGDEF)-like protein/PAS domain S-box-containing protein
MMFKLRLTPTLVAVLSGLLMLAYTGYGMVHERAEAIEHAKLQTQNFARVLEEHARQTLHRVSAILDQADAALASLRRARVLDVPQAQRLLTQLLPVDRLIQNVLLLDGTGALLLSTQADLGAGYGSGVDSDYFVPHVRGADRELVFGSPVKAADGQWLLPVSRRMGNAGGALDGVLVVMVRAAYFQDFYDSVERGSDGFLTLFLSSGSAVVTSPRADNVIGKNWSHSPMFRQHLPAWPTGTVRQVVVKDGIERIYSYRALNDYPVVVTYGLSMATILSEWQVGAWHDGLMLAAALLLLGGAAVTLKRQEVLRRAARKALRERAKHSQSLLRLSKKLELSQTYAEVVKAAQDEVKATLGYQNLWVYLFTEDKKQAKALIVDGPVSEPVLSEEGIATLSIEGDRMLEEIAEAKEIVVVEDARTDERTNKEIVAKLGNRTIVNAPIIFFNKHLGMVGTGTFGEEGVRVPTPDEQAFLSAIASHLAVTLDRIHLLTERKQAEEALRIAATAFESQQGMAITNVQRVILRVNKAFTTITGYSAEEAIGQTPRILASGRHDSAFYAAMTQALETSGAWQGEIWNRRKNGEIYPEWLTISGVKDKAGLTTHYVAIFNDVSERVNAQTQIDTLAFYDPLTQLPNRRLLLDRLDQALHVSTRHARQNALLFVDLDNFKTLNDTLGHSQGDALLVQVAQRLKTCIREGDTVARLGSDEFVVMLEDLSEDHIGAATQVETVGEKILNVFLPDFSLDSGTHHSTPSIGITLFGGVVEGSEQPLKRAELAMFQAKAAGRNTLRFFDTRMQAEVSAHAALEADLREAVTKQQFLLHYQPQVVGTGRVTGVEALVRWQHPLRGMVSPAEFIPLAEESGLILSIGQWVLETACVQLAVWATQPELEHLTIAVNVSARQFKQSDFVDGVLATLASTRANPKRLKLELTESMLVDDVEAIIAKMGALKAHGIGFSLDDFGTGYSSLAYLKRLPLDQLKIDQGFIRNIVTDPNEASIAKMVVALAESMGLSVIAEGVELQAQADFLAHLGCHAYQGYLFSKPLPLDALEAFAHGDDVEANP